VHVDGDRQNDDVTRSYQLSFSYEASELRHSCRCTSHVAAAAAAVCVCVCVTLLCVGQSCAIVLLFSMSESRDIRAATMNRTGPRINATEITIITCGGKLNDCCVQRSEWVRRSRRSRP